MSVRNTVPPCQAELCCQADATAPYGVNRPTGCQAVAGCLPGRQVVLPGRQVVLPGRLPGWLGELAKNGQNARFSDNRHFGDIFFHTRLKHRLKIVKTSTKIHQRTNPKPVKMSFAAFSNGESILTRQLSKLADQDMKALLTSIQFGISDPFEKKYGDDEATKKLFWSINYFLRRPDSWRYRTACKECCRNLESMDAMDAENILLKEADRIGGESYHRVILSGHLDLLCTAIQNRRWDTAVSIIHHYCPDQTDEQIKAWLDCYVRWWTDRKILWHVCGSKLDPNWDCQQLVYDANPRLNFSLLKKV